MSLPLIRRWPGFTVLLAAALGAAGVACSESEPMPGEPEVAAPPEPSGGQSAGGGGAGDDAGPSAMGGAGGAVPGEAGAGGQPARFLDPEYQAAAVEGRPLLDALSVQSGCSVVGAPVLLGSDVGVLLPTDEGMWFAFAGNSRGSGADADSGVSVAQLMLGALRPATFTHVEPTRVPQLNGGVDGERITLLWRRDRPEPSSKFGSVSELALAQLDERGALLSGPRAVTGSAVGEYDARLVPTADGFVMFWIQSATNSFVYQARVARLDHDGQLRGPPEVLLERDSYLLTESLNVLGERVLATYRGDEGLTTVFLDTEGHPVGPPLAIGESHWSATLPRGERALSVWSVDVDGPPTANSITSSEDGHSIARILRVGWFDREGKHVGASRDVQAPVPDEENVHPVWIDLGDDVGLLWSQGSVIYICSGCMPDNHLNFVVLDGATLAPKSNVVRLENPAPRGGLIHPQISGQGSDLLVVAEVGYHTSAESMTATLRCAR